MALLDGLTSAPQSGTASGANPSPSAQGGSGLLMGLTSPAPQSAGLLTGLKETKQPDASFKDGFDVKSLVDMTSPSDTSNLFSGFLGATKSPTAKTGVTPSSLVANSDPVASAQTAPKLVNNDDFKKESSYLDSQSKTITDISSKLDAENTKVEALKKSLDLMEGSVDQSDQKSVDSYNAKVKEYNDASQALQGKIESFNKSYGDYKARVDSYNGAVKNANTQSVYTGPSLTGTSIESYKGQTTPANYLQERLADIPHLPSWIAKNEITDAFGNTLDDAADKLYTFFSSLDSRNNSTSKSVVGFISLAGAVADVAFAIPSAIFGAVKEIPGAKTALHPVEAYMNMIGNAMNESVQYLMNGGDFSAEANNEVSKALGELVSTATQAWLLGKSFETITPIVKEKSTQIKTILTKDLIVNHTPAQSVYFEAAKVKDIWQTGKLLTEEERGDIVKTLGSDPQAIRDAIKNGVSIGVDARTIVTLEEKPYWSKIKSFFGVEPVEPKVISDTGAKPAVTVRGFISGKNDVHPVLKDEVAKAVEEHGIDVTQKTLEEKLGLDAETATQVIKDSTSAKTIEEIASTGKEIIGKIEPESVDTTPDARAPKGSKETMIRIGAKEGEWLSGKTTLKGDAVDASNKKVSYSKLGDIGSGKQPILTIKKQLIDAGVSLKDVASILSRTPRIDGQTWTDNVFDAITSHNDAVKALKEPVKTEVILKNKELYHGTNQTFETFDSSKIKTGSYKGINFADTKEAALAHGDKLMTSSISGRFFDVGNSSEEAKILKDNGGDEQTLQKKLQEEGYHGIKKGTEYVVFDQEVANKGIIKSNILNTQGGFANPSKMIEDIVKGADAKIKDFVENTMEPIVVSDNLSEDFAKLEGAAQADLETVNKLVESLDIDKADDEALYTHAEDPKAPLTKHQQDLEKKFDLPLKRANDLLYRRIEEITGTSHPEQDNYISRFPKEKPSVMQRIFDPASGRSPSAGQGGVLSKSASSLKKRTMKSITDEKGIRTVVSIKDKEVTAFENKTPRSLGKLKIKPKAELLETEIQPLRNQVGAIQKTIATLERLNSAQKVVSEARIKNLSKEIGDMIKFVDSHVGVFSNSELRPTVRKIQDKSIEFNTLTKVKETIDNNAITRGERLKELQSQMIELVNKMAEIENKYNPDDLNQKVFVGNDGKQYTIGEATTKEIEQHTNLEYHHSALASRLMQYVKLRQIDRANQFLESWKNSSDFSKVGLKSDQIPPEGWIMTKQQNFRNYFFEPRTAEILDDMQKKMEGGMYNDAFQGINRVLADAIFFNGLAHPINVFATWAYNRGISSLALPSAYKTGLKSFSRALKAMSTKNEDYMNLLRNGAHLMSSDVTNKKLAENIMKKLGDDIEKSPDVRDKIIKLFGNVVKQIFPKSNIIYKISHDMAWLSNDLFTMQSIFEAMDRYGMTMDEAIKDVSRFIPDYRQQSRLLDKPLSAVLGKMGGATSRNFAKNIMYNRNISMFGSYHVGLFQSLWNALKDTFNPKSDKASRTRSIDKLAMLAFIGLVIYPWIDKEIQKLTGNSNSYITRSGVFKYPYLAYKYVTGKANTTQVLTGVITPAVGTQSMAEIFFNRDLFTGNNIYGIGGEGLGGFIANKIAPISELKKISTDSMTPGHFALSFLGIHTPKNDQVAIDLNNMIYNEKPNVMREIKALVAGKDIVGAQKVGHEFNTKLADIIKDADIQAGNSGSDARVQFFLNQYGVKMPGPVAMANFNAKQGQNIVDKTLPNGKPIIVKDTPVTSDSVIGTVITYAKAIGSDPITAFKDIFSGQKIKSVTNGTVIVERMSLAESQAQKSKLGGGSIPKGMILDHHLSLELGGTNDESNLELVPEAQAKADDVIENYLGRALKNGKIDKATAQKMELDYKDHKITFDEIKKQVDK